ncbi:hypothetical protein QBC39DRAFT_306110 [Podospora conica]|nr:hypothetical protein QBC39DRAFT_306110 [Schizothecium conicum]
MGSQSLVLVFNFARYETRIRPVGPLNYSPGPRDGRRESYKPALQGLDMLSESPLKFAQKASSKLQEVVNELCSPPPNSSYHQFCAAIQTTLHLVVPRFQALPDTRIFRNEASELLDTLETLCQVRHTNDSVIQPIETPGRRYPSLVHLLNDDVSAKEAIKEFARCDDVRARKRFLKRLKDFEGDDESTPCSASSGALSSLPDIVVQAENGAPPECGREIVLLHSTLSTYCFCITETVHRPTAACIRLRSSNLGDTKVTFGVLFMGHPHQHIHGAETKYPPLWQDTEISLYRTVQTGGGTLPADGQAPLEFGCPPDDSRFCYYISLQDQIGPALLHFSVTQAPVGTDSVPMTSVPVTSVGKEKLDKKRLYIDALQNTDIPRAWRAREPSISLRRLLETVAPEDFSQKKKEVLSVSLAKAVWQYYSSPWMASPWTKDNVHFIFEQRRTVRNEELQGIFVDEPLLSISISVPSLQNTEVLPARASFGAVHKLPKLLALGVMLMEIQLGHPIQTLYTNVNFSRHCGLEGMAYANTDYNICKDLIEKGQIFMVKDTSVPLSTLITNCILPRQVFMPPRVKDLTDECIRPALYDLVSQLEVWSSGLQPGNLQPLSLPESMERTPSSTQAAHRCSPLKRHDEKRRYYGRTMAQLTNSRTTEDWFTRMRSLVHILKAPDEDEDKYKKVKIAVLDTGVHPDHPETRYIEGYQDFVTGNHDVRCDNTGHGTTLVGLIFEMCDSADVYALRILEDDTATEKTPQRAVLALDWCIANNIDIVCMAWGLTNDDAKLYHKVRDASCKMLLIAAPTNEGNQHSILYPAAYEEFVLPMFATNGHVKNSGLNPSKGPGRNNFAILGEDIKNCHDKVGSGTSYSTAIAAALAARLLDFSRHSDTKSIFGDKAEKLKRKKEFKRVLSSIAVQSRDGSFRYIRPWDLLPTKLQRHLPVLPAQDGIERSKARDEICHMICLFIDREFG